MANPIPCSFPSGFQQSLLKWFYVAANHLLFKVKKKKKLHALSPGQLVKIVNNAMFSLCKRKWKNKYLDQPVSGYAPMKSALSISRSRADIKKTMTSQQTNRRGWKRNLLGGGENRISKRERSRISQILPPAKERVHSKIIVHTKHSRLFHIPPAQGDIADWCGDCIQHFWQKTITGSYSWLRLRTRFLIKTKNPQDGGRRLRACIYY